MRFRSHVNLRIHSRVTLCFEPVCVPNAAVLNSSPRAPPLYIFFMSLLVNTPDSDNQLVRSALHEWTVFRLTCSLHSVHCSLLPEQGKAAEVYFTSEHSFMDLRCATSLRTDECDTVNIYNLNSRLAHFNALWMEYVRFELESWRNIVWCPLRRALAFE